ncbi:MAG: AAA family ATPase, partial [Verrucomicrobiota bacterium]
MERALDTTRDLLSYWQLQERPFEATWDTRFYYPTADHDEALDRLSFLVTEQSMNMGLLTGDIGCGKTLLRAVFAEQLEADEHFEIVVQENSGFGFRDLLGSILAELGDEQGGRRS